MISLTDDKLQFESTFTTNYIAVFSLQNILEIKYHSAKNCKKHAKMNKAFSPQTTVNSLVEVCDTKSTLENTCNFIFWIKIPSFFSIIFWLLHVYYWKYESFRGLPLLKSKYNSNNQNNCANNKKKKTISVFDLLKTVFIDSV